MPLFWSSINLRVFLQRCWWRSLHLLGWKIKLWRGSPQWQTTRLDECVHKVKHKLTCVTGKLWNRHTLCSCWNYSCQKQECHMLLQNSEVRNKHNQFICDLCVISKHCQSNGSNNLSKLQLLSSYESKCKKRKCHSMIQKCLIFHRQCKCFASSGAIQRSLTKTQQTSMTMTTHQENRSWTKKSSVFVNDHKFETIADHKQSSLEANFGFQLDLKSCRTLWAKLDSFAKNHNVCWFQLCSGKI